MIRLQFISDLHLERLRSNSVKLSEFLTPVAPYLAIIGDLSQPHLPNFQNFLFKSSREFDKVLYVPGNHEYMSKIRGITPLNRDIKDVCSQFKNVYCLDNDHHHLSDNVVVIGSTLWSNIYPLVSENNYRGYFQHIRISSKRTMTNKYYQKLHTKSVRYLEKTVEQYPDKRVVILTHYLPTFKLVAEKYRISHAKCLSMYASDVEHIIKKKNVDYWLCGHTHSEMDVSMKGCRLLTNPCGYGSELTHKFDAFIEISDVIV